MHTDARLAATRPSRRSRPSRAFRAAALGAALCLPLAVACAKRVAEPAPEGAMARDARTDGVQTAAATAEQRQAPGSPAGGAPPGQQQQAPPASAADAGRKLVKTVDLDLRVKDTAAAAEQLRALAARLGGFVAAMSAERRDGLLYYTMTLRVPVARLDEALRQAHGLAARVDREAIRTEDVTERWVDIDARLVTLRATETELRQLLTEARQRGQKVEDIMAVYDKLTEIRSTIEQLEGERKSLEGLTSLSTINVQLVPTEGARPIAEGWQPGDTARQSFRALLRGLQATGDLLIVVLVVVLPLGLVILGPLYLLLRVVRRRRARRDEG